MTLAAAAFYWLSVFAQTFLLGFQSRNVNTGRYLAAGLTSLLLSASQLVVVRTVATGEWLMLLPLTGTAGPLGIIAAMAFSRRFFERESKP